MLFASRAMAIASRAPSEGASGCPGYAEAAGRVGCELAEGLGTATAARGIAAAA